MLGIVTGLRAEARIARRLGVALAGGGTPSGARRAAQALVDAGATALLSFGLAGGLDPARRAGDLVVPVAILCGGHSFTTTPGLVRSNGVGTLAAEPVVVATVRAKAALWERTGAVAVDLESGSVAEVAAAHGLPFAVLRAICDPADRDLPPTALAALDSRGAIAGWRVAGSLFRHPGDIGGLIALARDVAAARKNLVCRVGQIVDADVA